MNNQKSMQYILVVMIQRIIGMVLFFGMAGTWAVPRGWIYFAVYLTTALIGCWVLLRHNPDVLSARAKNHEGAKSWDKGLVSLYVLLAFYGIYVVAGLDIRLDWSQMPVWLIYPALAVYVFSSIVGIWAMMENRHFEATVRIQRERGHAVCTAGPYAVVRHPGYTSIILWAVALPFMIGSAYTGIVCLVIILLIGIRTRLEDNTLQKELPGYLEYTGNTKYRLVPFIW